MISGKGKTGLQYTGVPEWTKPFVALVLLFVFPGCGFLPKTALKPVPAPVSSTKVIQRVRRNTHRFQTVVDTHISLYLAAEKNGKWDDMPSLGGLLAFDSQRPGLWLRAEKLGQKIFVLRAGMDYFWLELPDSNEIVTGGPEAYNRLPHLVQPAEAMLWFAGPEWLGLTWDKTEMVVEKEHYRFDVSMSGQIIRKVYIDRRDMHLTRIKMFDFFGRLQTDVRMNRYRNVDGVPFPFRLIVRRPLVGYRIELRLKDPDFNKDIPGQFFEPRKRPEWKHIDLDYEPITRIEAFR